MCYTEKVENKYLVRGVILKKLLSLAFCVFVIVSLFGCYNDDDFAPYESYSKTVNTAISVEMDSLSDIIPEIDKIAQKQQSNLVLTSVTMIFEGRDNCANAIGTIIFGYAKPHDTRNQISKMDIYYNMETKTVEKFDWEKGHGKRVSCVTDEIGDKYITLPLSEILACFNQNSEYVTKIDIIEPRLRIKLDFNRLSAYLEDLSTSNNTIVFRYNDSDDKNVEESSWTPETWQKVYEEFLSNTKNYVEDGHFAGNYALADIDNDGTPELIIAFFNGIEGGYIFANIYSYDGNVNRIGQRIDMYYKSCWFSSDPTISGLFVEGGRNSTFACNYWSIKENKFVVEALWTDAYNSDTKKMDYKELSNNSQLINEAKRAISFHPDGTVDFFEINEANIQKIYR